MQTFEKAVPESMLLLTGFAARTPSEFRKPLVYCTVNQVSESRFISLLK
jgi:hypothetical protein